MAQLVVRNIDDEVKRRLKARAEARGHSMEEEVRQILRDATLAPSRQESGLGMRIARMFEDIGLREGELTALPGEEPRIPEFD